MANIKQGITVNKPSFPKRPQIRVQGVKPLLRGVADVLAVIVAVPAVAFLIAHAQARATLSAAIYGASVFLLFATSAIYHVPMWPKHIRRWLQRLDHSAIYVLIAGTYTPFCLLALEPQLGHILLGVVWTIAGLGLLKSFFWTHAPRFITTIIYVGFGWLMVPFVPQLVAGADALSLVLLAIGGMAYTSGAMVYAKRWPNPDPAIFGYHEIFHIFVIFAAACHYLAVWVMVM
ncbi:MAG: hemolysin III family protein [Myxococcota bacterium]